MAAEQRWLALHFAFGGSRRGLSHAGGGWTLRVFTDERHGVDAGGAAAVQLAAEPFREGLRSRDSGLLRPVH